MTEKKCDYCCDTTKYPSAEFMDWYAEQDFSGCVGPIEIRQPCKEGTLERIADMLERIASSGIKLQVEIVNEDG